MTHIRNLTLDEQAATEGGALTQIIPIGVGPFSPHPPYTPPHLPWPDPFPRPLPLPLPLPVTTL
jgi:hypothetical protein